MTDAERKRAERVRNKFADIIQSVERGSRYYDDNGEDVTDWLFETARWGFDSANKLIEPN